MQQLTAAKACTSARGKQHTDDGTSGAHKLSIIATRVSPACER
jgi:hypothetical protein